MPRLPVLAVSCALLVACAGPDRVDTDAAVAVPTPAAAVDVPERHIPDDSLYPLLVAEFALRRNAYDVALENYMQQAPLLRDAGVSAHTTHLTQFMGQEEAALEASGLWVELDPENPEANNTYAMLLVRKGRQLDALPYLAVVERHTGAANFPMLLQGYEALDDAQRGALAAGINRLATEFPDNSRVLLTQALILAEAKNYPQALRKLDRVFRDEPEDGRAILLEAKILADQGVANPYARIERQLEKNPDDQMLRLRYARLLAATDMAAAREQFEILSSQAPQDGDMLFSLALINREMGDLLAASAYLRQLIELDQRVDEAHYYLGRIAEDRDDTEDALKEYMAVGDGREYLAANSRIGYLLIDGGQFARSRAWFDEQRAERPQRRSQLFGLEADLLAQADRRAQAIDLLGLALAESPDDHGLRYARAMLLEQEDELAVMESELRMILAEDPENTTAMNALGYTLANRTTRYEEALQLVSRALELEPDEPAIIDSMGWVLYRLGRYQEALDYLTRAYAAFPDPEVASHLGEVLWVIGDREAARAIWRGAAAIDPDHPVLLGTLRRLGVDSLDATPPPEEPS